MRPLIIALPLLFGALAPAQSQAQVSVGIGVNLPGVSIGINMPAYPQLVRVPGYPVYYAPGVSSNYFFYDGLYWVYTDDGWYSSDWYNGPWALVQPLYVPVFILRVPVRYYRRPPTFFGGWRGDAAPHWGDHWGRDWQSRRSGWDRWDRRSAPAAAPLPVYQRAYTGDRYPRAPEQQREVRAQNYRYQPRETVSREVFTRAPGGSGGAEQRPAPAPRPLPQVQPPRTGEQTREQGAAPGRTREAPPRPPMSGPGGEPQRTREQAPRPSQEQQSRPQQQPQAQPRPQPQAQQAQPRPQPQAQQPRPQPMPQPQAQPAPQPREPQGRGGPPPERGHDNRGGGQDNRGGGQDNRGGGGGNGGERGRDR